MRRLSSVLFLCLTVAVALNPLEGLPKLQKVHHSWPLPANVIDLENPIFVDFARITGSVGLGAGTSQDKIETCVAVCKKVNCTIAFNYSPWYHAFPKTAPPTYDGPEVTTELDLYRSALTNISQYLEQANAAQQGTVQIGAVLLDSERFAAVNSSWGEAITTKHEEIWNITRQVLPNVRVEWYNRGAVARSASPTGWKTVELFTLDESFANDTAYGISLYSVPEIGYTRESYTRTAGLAESHGVKLVTPWIALGCGYRRTIATHGERTWDFGWDYDEVYSWELGAEINNPWYAEYPERFAPWDKATVVAMYPSVFDTRSPVTNGTSAMLRHFATYVKGAHGITDMS